MNNRVSLQCCLRLKPILEHQFQEDIEGIVDPTDEDQAYKNADKQMKKAFRAYKSVLRDSLRRVKTQMTHHVVEHKSVCLVLDSEFGAGWIFK